MKKVMDQLPMGVCEEHTNFFSCLSLSGKFSRKQQSFQHAVFIVCSRVEVSTIYAVLYIKL